LLTIGKKWQSNQTQQRFVNTRWCYTEHKKKCKGQFSVSSLFLLFSVFFCALSLFLLHPIHRSPWRFFFSSLLCVETELLLKEEKCRVCSSYTLLTINKYVGDKVHLHFSWKNYTKRNIDWKISYLNIKQIYLYGLSMTA